MAIEIERKFSVRDSRYKEQAKASYNIIQGYLSSSTKQTVRIRIRAEQAFITIKSSSNKSGLSRYEWEKEIPLDDGKKLLQLCGNKTLSKTRYLVDYEGHTFEIDEFHELNNGLVVAEIELTSEDEYFEKPEWLGEELTGDIRYYNSHLIKNPYSTWNKTI